MNSFFSRAGLRNFITGNASYLGRVLPIDPGNLLSIVHGLTALIKVPFSSLSLLTAFLVIHLQQQITFMIVFTHGHKPCNRPQQTEFQ